LLAHPHAAQQQRRLEHIQAEAHLAARRAARPSTIYVSPRGRLGGNAGRSPARPLRSINAALKLVKRGGTIILAPGVYTENVTVTNSRNVTIVGAGDRGTILAAGSRFALLVSQSSNITIANLWLRSGGSGLVLQGSSVTVQDIRTDGTLNDGVVATTSSLTAIGSHFDSVQLGRGLLVTSGSSATISSSTFDNNGTNPSTGLGEGLVVEKDGRVSVTGSDFSGNTGSGLAGQDNAQISVTGSTFNSNVNGDGAIFSGQASVQLTGNNVFQSNGPGKPRGPSGLNGVEFFANFTGTATVSGNQFLNNTGNGLYVGGSPNMLQITNNMFVNNYVGIGLDSAASGTQIMANIQGNQISVPAGSTQASVGILAIGGGLSATIGGPGTAGNTILNYANNTFIYEATGDVPSQNTGSPHLNIQANTFMRDGQSISPGNAINPA
jgi:hypothetical protein